MQSMDSQTMQRHWGSDCDWTSGQHWSFHSSNWNVGRCPTSLPPPPHTHDEGIRQNLRTREHPQILQAIHCHCCRDHDRDHDPDPHLAHEHHRDRQGHQTSSIRSHHCPPHHLPTNPPATSAKRTRHRASAASLRILSLMQRHGRARGHPSPSPLFP